jgi:hypothetical protein
VATLRARGARPTAGRLTPRHLGVAAPDALARLAALNHAFVIDNGPPTTVDLGAHCGESDLEDLDLGHDEVDLA